MAQDLNIDQAKLLEGVQRRQQLIVLTCLILLYAGIPIAASANFVFQILFQRASEAAEAAIDTNFLIELLGPLSTPKGSVLEALHKLILPLSALFLGANFAMLRTGRLAAWLFVIPLVGTIAALVAASLLDAFATSEVRTSYSGLNTLFRDMASNLGIFLMLLIGQTLERK